ncbi:uncharacterized protein [Palaemon carinicauda]|uniref:uncharacterized protein n=1 Tax=Palaemon carinicauda TaxID=392227 RepID=UPI0035B67F26
MAENQPTDITQLIEQTERTEFLSAAGPDQKNGTEDDLRIISSFIEESKPRLSIIEAEKIFDNRLVTSEDDAKEDVSASKEELREENDEEPDERRNAFQILEQALHDLIHIKDLLPANEASGGCRPRTMSTGTAVRQASTWQTLESNSYKKPSITNDVLPVRRPVKVMSDITSLDEELAKLLTMRDSLDYQPQAPPDPEPFPVPLTPPSTPATSFFNPPLSPTELYNRGHRTESLPGSIVPPPKPPRAFQTSTVDAKTDESQIKGEEGSRHIKGPPKPPRLNSNSSIDKKVQLVKMSKSMSNLSVLDESQGSGSKSGEPSSAECLGVDSKDMWKTTGNKVENFFSKFSTKKRNKRSKSFVISDPSDFRHVSGKSNIRELQTENLPSSAATTSSSPEKLKTMERTNTASTKTTRNDEFVTPNNETGTAIFYDESSRNKADSIEAPPDQLRGSPDIAEISPNTEDERLLKSTSTEDIMSEPSASKQEPKS